MENIREKFIRVINDSKLEVFGTLSLKEETHQVAIELERIAIESQLDLIEKLYHNQSMHIIESKGFPDGAAILRILRDSKKDLENQLKEK